MIITVDLSEVEAIALLAFLRSVNTSGVLSSAEHEAAFDMASEKLGVALRKALGTE